MKKSKLIIFIISMIILFGVLSAVFMAVYHKNRSPLCLTLLITSFTFFYHFAMRLIVGEVVTLIYKNRDFHYDNDWYKQKKFEKKLYKFLRVKKWKGKMITARPEQFDVKTRTKKELLHNITQAEIVHEIIIALSFLPLAMIIPYGAPWAFILTSIGAALIDSVFVIIQRYNRPRILKLLALTKSE
ncbi:MAG: hypothetical protein KBS52_01930 [Clostridiales bacterium]|nr:hypothetical protein [Candidatus Equinaster intestinalis]